ncbi:MAG: hypothetical protein IT385_22225 [Deltaproteobacteria bacterium]|nr:hypothetical protein [Deltaproteobacteria bacterium]
MTHCTILSLTATTLLALAACGDDAVSGASDTTTTATDAAGDTAADVADTTVAEPDVSVDPGAFCQGATGFAWDPAAGAFLAAFPDDALTRDDASSLTGLRVSLGQPAWLDAEATALQPLWRQLEELDGFGTSAGVFLRFDAPLGPVPTGSSASVNDLGLRFYDLSGEVAERVAFESQVIEGGKGVILWPLRPLREHALHAVVLTRDHVAADGGCVAPSAALRGLVGRTASDEGTRRLFARADRLFAMTDVARADVSALTLFTTQAITEVTLAQRATVAARDYTWKTAPTCSTKQAFRECRGSFEALDMRREGYLGDDVEPSVYTLPVRVWLPKERGAEPAPLLVFGHGLGGDARQAAGIAQLAAPMGIAVVALPAPRHGDHPTARGDDPNAFFLDLLGIDLAAFTIDGFVFRENVRQAMFDKLQLMRLLTAAPEIDGEAGADLDTSRVAYWGISLGGIMGSDFAALSEDVDLAVLSIAGARVLSIVTDAAQFASFKNLLATVAGGEDAVARIACVGQSIVDAGDPVNWVTRLVDDRLDATPRAPPHVLVQMVIDDEVVPNVATRALARAVGVVEQVPPVVVDIDPLAATGAAPIAGNRDAATTVGLFQFDRVSTSPGRTPIVATHNNVFSGIEAIGQVERFLATWLEGRAPEISDPYADYDTPPLP